MQEVSRGKKIGDFSSGMTSYSSEPTLSAVLTIQFKSFDTTASGGLSPRRAGLSQNGGDKGTQQEAILFKEIDGSA
ncbi:MAG TPA: hypothetical protein VMB19_03675 [Silvibacterium sp.]|nr:hypothetical protein [Silvibacterium sp.]